MAMGKNPHVVGIETLKKNGINVDDLIKELVATRLLNSQLITTSRCCEQIAQAWRVKESRV